MPAIAGEAVLGSGGFASREAPGWRTRIDRPLVTGLIALTGWAAFVLLRLWLAAHGNITMFVRAAAPFTNAHRVPAGLFTFPADGYDGQFYYRLALDPADLRRTAFGITMDLPFRVQRIGYPALAWLLSLGQHAWVPVAMVMVNLLALTALAVAGGVIARDGGRPALAGLLLAVYFGFFICVGCDLTEPVAAACLIGGVLALRRDRPVLAGLLFGYGALTRETVLVAPLAFGLTRLIAVVRERARPARADLAWCLPVVMFAGWQLVLRITTGTLVLAASLSSNSASGLPGTALAGAVRLNLGLVKVATGAGYIWFAEAATLVAITIAGLISWRSAAGPAYERLAFLAYILELGFLSSSIWAGHADLRSVDEVYLFAILVLLGTRRGIGKLALCAGATVIVAAAHQALYL